MKILSIIPECFVDNKVAEIIGRSTYNHQHGCGDVANILQNKLKDRAALGIIDEDKNKGLPPKYFSEFQTINQTNNLILKKHVERRQFLILICPEIEKWLMLNAKAVAVDMSNYNLPENLKGLTQLTKRKKIEHNNDFPKFIKELIKKEAPGIITLKQWIENFKSIEL